MNPRIDIQKKGEIYTKHEIKKYKLKRLLYGAVGSKTTVLIDSAALWFESMKLT